MSIPKDDRPSCKARHGDGEIMVRYTDGSPSRETIHCEACDGSDYLRGRDDAYAEVLEIIEKENQRLSDEFNRESQIDSRRFLVAQRLQVLEVREMIEERRRRAAGGVG